MMLPDLGKYHTEVLLAYGVSALVLVLFVWWTLRRSKRVKARLEEIDKR